MRSDTRWSQNTTPSHRAGEPSIIIASDLFKTTPVCPRSVVGMAPTFNGLSIGSADMATSLAFYRRLGLDIPAEADHAPHAEAVVDGGIRLMWDCGPEFPPNPGGPSLAFLCAGPEEVDAVHADLVAAGYTSKMAPWDAEWGQRYAVVLDADGYSVDLFAWMK